MKKVKILQSGETILIRDDASEFEAYINPHGNYESGIPSIYHRSIANRIVTAVNSYDELVSTLKTVSVYFDKVTDPYNEQSPITTTETELFHLINNTLINVT